MGLCHCGLEQYMPMMVPMFSFVFCSFQGLSKILGNQDFPLNVQGEIWTCATEYCFMTPPQCLSASGGRYCVPTLN